MEKLKINVSFHRFVTKIKFSNSLSHQYAKVYLQSGSTLVRQIYELEQVFWPKRFCLCLATRFGTLILSWLHLPLVFEKRFFCHNIW